MDSNRNGGLNVEQALQNIDQALASVQGNRQVHEVLKECVRAIQNQLVWDAQTIDRLGQEKTLWESRANVLKDALRSLDPQNPLISEQPLLEAVSIVPQ